MSAQTSLRPPPVDLRASLLAAISSLAILTGENARLRREIADRDAMLKELQDMIGRLT